MYNFKGAFLVCNCCSFSTNDQVAFLIHLLKMLNKSKTESQHGELKKEHIENMIAKIKISGSKIILEADDISTISIPVT